MILFNCYSQDYCLLAVMSTADSTFTTAASVVTTSAAGVAIFLAPLYKLPTAFFVVASKLSRPCSGSQPLHPIL